MRLLCVVLLVGCMPEMPGSPEITIDSWDAGAPPVEGPDGGVAPAPDAAPVARLPGARCNCDAECQPEDGHEGLCVRGICMTRASAECEYGGSSGECPAGSRCWGVRDAAGSVCWPDCAAHACEGSCDGDGSCVPTDAMECDRACGEYCSGGPSTDPAAPGPGPGPECILPPLECTGGAAYCGDLIPFEPVNGPGYENYPINGETWDDQYRSWLRRDVVMLIQYASAKTDCKAGSWSYGNGGPIGLGDMSEEDGAIPGTSIGSPGHPYGSHTDGFDLDIGYFQVGTADNRLRPICDHTSGGSDVYHCVDEPYALDPWRTAMFLGALFEHPDIRIVGADGKIGPILQDALETLCADGWLTAYACDHLALTWEEVDEGRGWYRFHHHHFHVSFSRPDYAAPASPHEERITR